ncbi:translocation/assembly module TamB domain-containing protein [Capilliphycus salinus ALCB114379]|uniref:translocation/assembly module TamB domain-containing protein n=1 Tax=Capilliphycus salinus TaxID=2768948 RepID=UPI0039A49544
MTNSPNPNSESTSPRRRRWRRVLIWGGVGLGVTTIAAGTTAIWFIQNRLAPMVGGIVEGIIERPVTVGPVERVTFSSLRFGRSSIPATPTSDTNATTEAVEVAFSLSSIFTNPTLNLDITLVNADVYLEEDEEGDWIQTELNLEGDPPIDVQFGSVGLRNANVTLTPYVATGEPVVIPLNISRAVVDVGENNERIKGRLNGSFERGGTFYVQANVFTPDNDIQGRLRVNNIPLSQFTGLIKAPNFALQRGMVDANVYVNLVDSQLSQIQGQARLDDVKIEVTDLDRPIQPINAQFRFNGTQARIESLTTGLGDINVNLSGTATANPQLDISKTQLDFTANIEPTRLSTFLDIAQNVAEEPLNLPFPVSGAVQTDIGLKGTILKPVITVDIDSTAPVEIDKINLDSFSTQLNVTAQLQSDFSLESDPLLTVDSLQIQPATGGNITGEGTVKLQGLKELITANQAIVIEPINQPETPQTPPQTPTQPPAILPVPSTPTPEQKQEENPINPEINFNLDINNVGLDSLVESYGIVSPFRWGELSAEAQVSGTLENLKGEAEFALPAATAPIFGQADLDRNQLNAAVEIADGNININARQLQPKQWNANVNASQVALEPLVNIGLLFSGLEPSLKSDISRIDLSDGRLNLDAELIGNLDNLDPANIRAESDVQINLGERSINATAQIREGLFSANFDTEPLRLTRIIDIAQNFTNIPANTQDQIQDLEIQNGTVQAEGTVRGNINNLDQIIARTQALVNLPDTGGVIRASARVSGDVFQADIDTSTIPLNPLIDLGLPFANLSPEINNSIQNLDFRNGSLEAKGLFSGNLNNLDEITGTLNSQIDLGNFGGTVQARGQLTDNQFQVSVNTDEIPIEPLIDVGLPLANLSPNLNREIQNLNFRNGEIQLQATASGNLTNVTPSGITANVDGLINLGQEGGMVRLSGQALRGQWQTIINADRIALSRFSDIVESQTRDVLEPLEQQGLITQAEAMPLLRGLLDTQLSARGSLVELRPETIRAMGELELTELPIIKQPLEAAFNWDGERLEIEQLETPQFGADGFVAIEFSGTGAPQVSNLNVDVRLSDFDLQSPLIQRLLVNVPPEVAGEGPLIAGLVNFDGQLTGSLSTLQLTGDLSLENLIVRELEFDPILAGTVSAGLNQGINLALAGQEDRIELVLNDQYLPESFLLRQDQTIAQGRTVGENLLVNLEQFPLSTLSLAPLADQGIGAISGIATADVTISNLETLDPTQIGVQGAIAVDDPALGYIDLDAFNANISLANGLFQLTDGLLAYGETEILVAARADLAAIIADLQAGVTPFANPTADAAPDFEAEIDIPTGRLQDILAALEYYNLSDLVRGLQTPEYGTAADVQPVAVGVPPDATLTQQLQRFEEIQAILRRQLLKEEEEPLPPLQALRGSFTGEILVQGSIESGVTGQVAVKNLGDWTWGRFEADEFILNASLDPDNVIRVLPLQLTSEETVYDFRGQYALDKQLPSGQFRVKNIRLERLQDELENFVELPNIDVNGQLNFRANIAGTLANPQATGEFTVVEGSFNDEPIREARGSFSYNNARLFLGSNILLTEEDPIRIKASVPYRLPFAEVSAESNILEAQVNIQDEGFNVIDLLNPEIDWVEGTGLLELSVRGILEQAPSGEISRISIAPQGLLKLQDGVISLDSLEQSIVGLSGSATFVSDRVTVSGIEGELVGEAGTGNILVQGVLPIVFPFEEEDPDVTRPLRIALENLQVDVEELYTGDAAGMIAINGTVLRPEIGGQIILSNGTVILPVAAAATPEGGGGGLPDTGPVRIGLDNFRLTLGEDIQIETPPVSQFLSVPIVDFSAEGTIAVNGTLESLEDIRPSGVIELTGGALNLYATRFTLDRGYPQQAIFVPSEGLNPILDLRLVTRVTETTRFQAPTSAFPSEISESPTAANLGTVRTIRVTALVQGPASQINDIIELKSSPPRSQTQLIALLGGSTFEGITGDTTLVLANIASAGIFSQIQQNVLDATGLTEFRLYPARISKSEGSTASSALGLGIEIGLDVTDNVSVSLSQVLAEEQPTQFGVNYRVNDNLLIRGAAGLGGESEIRFEYEVQF